jgi:hypothetical protein
LTQTADFQNQISGAVKSRRLHHRPDRLFFTVKSLVGSDSSKSAWAEADG